EVTESPRLILKGCRQNNLKGFDVEIAHNELTVITGPSGSGKSSLAFETIYAEGQRRYVESLSPYVRQFVKPSAKPKLDMIEGLCPTVAIEQRLHAANPRSTVGTMTEVYDYLRLLFSRIGIPHCPKTGFQIRAISKEHVVEKILSYPVGEKLHLLAPIEMKRTDTFQDILERLKKQGFVRIRLNKTFYDLENKEIPYEPKRKNELMLVIDRIKVDPSMKLRLLEAVSTASTIGKGKLVVQKEHKDGQQEDVFFNLAFAVEETGESYPEITPQTFAFNTPYGMCPECQGLGFIWGIDLMNLTEGSQKPHTLFSALIGDEANPLVWQLFKLIMEEEPTAHEFFTGTKKQVASRLGGRPFRCTFTGVNHAVEEALKHHSGQEPLLPEEWVNELKENRCNSCQGTRLNALARHVTINKQSIADVAALPMDQAERYIRSLKIDYKDDLTLKQVHDELKQRLHFLNTLGLNYLSLERSAPTLSGGEAQRVRLARQIGSGLTGVLYVLDEPTLGLHPADCQTLMSALHTLKEHGNTLLVVEHDEEVIKGCDNVITLGPGSGKFGGELIKKNGKVPAQLLECTKANYKKSKDKNEALIIKNASIHNLQSVSTSIPFHALTCLTGVSGSGKSTLMFDVIQK
ncbi:MAG TPA: hypothetical protein VN457_04050, partial [Chlamydiales bacterium]|nr:hypothetical protein [Chlamydiales bacterium]